jgi:3-phosphoshikimate 1-carboxyvinyltransferase
MGIFTSQIGKDTIIIHGKGLHGLTAPDIQIDAGNSGTTVRLLMGLLAGQPFQSLLTGDDSLKKRPMDRVVLPLRAMGACIEGQNNCRYLPLSIKGSTLNPIDYTLPVASAQVKSAIILAALYASGCTSVQEPIPCRNHTELMLNAFGGRVNFEGSRITICPVNELYGQSIRIPGDISSASFLLTAGLLVPRSELTLKGVGINPTRTGILDVYKQMGADIRIENSTFSGGEPTADLTVKTSDLKGITIGGSLIPRLIDEIPVIALAATQAQGTTLILDAGELRVKESDRIQTIVQTLSSLGAHIEATEDGMRIHGPTPLKGTTVDSFGDHRIAMTAAVAGLIAQGDTIIRGSECIGISFPGFFEIIKKIS